jgi:hypothetical protein
MTHRDDIGELLAKDDERHKPPSAGVAWLLMLAICSWIPILAVAVRCYRGAHG